MATPPPLRPEELDPERNKRLGLSFARQAAQRYADSDAKRATAFRFAHDSGASLREIADATGVPHMTVKRIVDRAEAS